MWRSSVSMTVLRGRCGCTSAGGHRDRRAGDVVGWCGPRAGAASSWWTCRRSGGRCGWCGTISASNSDAEHPARGVRRARSASRTLPSRPQRALLTARAGRWATRRAGRGEATADTAAVLGCGWHTVNASVRRWSQALLDADGDRIAAVVAPGLDETLFCRGGRFAQRAWSTSIVDVARGQLLDMVPGRTADGPARWLLRRPASWLEQIRWAVLDLSGPYRAAYDTAVPDAAQVADPFHVVRLANTALDEVRRRVQNQTLGHRGHAHDPLHRARKLLVSASQNTTDNGRTKLLSCVSCSTPETPTARSATPGTAEETLRSIYDIADADLGAATVDQFAQDLQDPALPPEINRLGRTISNWRHQIANWHAARVTNAATEAAILWSVSEGVAFGFTNFNNYPIRALLYAGKPNWALLDTLTPP